VNPSKGKDDRRAIVFGDVRPPRLRARQALDHAFGRLTFGLGLKLVLIRWRSTGMRLCGRHERDAEASSIAHSQCGQMNGYGPRGARRRNRPAP